MADFVKLTKRGIVSYEWDSETRTYVPARKGANNLPNLRLRCEIEDDVTLGDIFKAVQADPDLMEFIAAYSWCGAIEKFHAQARKPHVPENEPDEDRITHLEISAYGEFWEYNKAKDGIEEFEGIHVGFSGISPATNWSVSYTPMNDIAHLPVKINPNVQFSKSLTEERVAKYNMSLLEVLFIVFWDISFHGGPEDNEAFIEEMKDRIAQIESGEATTKPFEFGTME